VLEQLLYRGDIDDDQKIIALEKRFKYLDKPLDLNPLMVGRKVSDKYNELLTLYKEEEVKTVEQEEHAKTNTAESYHKAASSFSINSEEAILATLLVRILIENRKIINKLYENALKPFADLLWTNQVEDKEKNNSIADNQDTYQHFSWDDAALATHIGANILLSSLASPAGGMLTSKTATYIALSTMNYIYRTNYMEVKDYLFGDWSHNIVFDSTITSLVSLVGDFAAHYTTPNVAHVLWNVASSIMTSIFYSNVINNKSDTDISLVGLTAANLATAASMYGMYKYAQASPTIVGGSNGFIGKTHQVHKLGAIIPASMLLQKCYKLIVATHEKQISEVVKYISDGFSNLLNYVVIKNSISNNEMEIVDSEEDSLVGICQEGQVCKE
jgi:hypothetical protein